MAILPVGIGSAEEGGYQIERSLRFNSADSPYLTRTPSTASGYDQWTFSCWFKRLALGETQYFIGGNTLTSGNTRNELISGIDGNDKLFVWAFNNGSGYYFNRFSSDLYRDPGAWYHLVIQFDPDNGTSANKIIAYINGVQVTWGSSADSGAAGNIGSSAYRSINNTYRNDIGGGYQGGGAPIYFSNAYMTEIYMVSGSIVAETDFGEVDANTGVWQPKAYTGSYGTNGFYLNFSDNASTTTLGDDLSGNGNNWTPNNFSVTAGAGNDSLVDTPTPYGTDTGVGGEVRGNYATLNPLVSTDSGLTYANGNLNVSGGSASLSTRATISTIVVTSGKWYSEINVGTTNNGAYVGIVRPTNLGVSRDICWNYFDNLIYPSGSAFSGTATSGDIIGIAYDADAGTVQFYKNGSTIGSLQTGATVGVEYGFYVEMGSGGQVQDWNFGQRTFAYTAPSGFKALCTQNLPEPTIVDGSQYFGTLTWSGDDTARTITSGSSGVDGDVDFTPDFTWFKRRNGATNGSDHLLLDAVRGVGTFNGLSTNGTEAEGFTPAGSSWQNFGDIQSFATNGFTVQKGTDPSHTYEAVNETGGSYVGWNWKANGAGVSNTDGTITSTVSANTTSGFSIVSWTGNATAGATIGHGLGVQPDFWIIKNRDNGTPNWMVGSQELTNPDRYKLHLNNNEAQGDWGSALWQTDSSVITLDAAVSHINGSGEDMIAYCFAAIPGYSAFGSYTGNGSADGPFVYTGFRPAFVILKRSDVGASWYTHDTARDTYNQTTNSLYPNLSAAEDQGYLNLDILSNGFKLRTTTSNNVSGGTYIYMAFAENPFKYSLAR